MGFAPRLRVPRVALILLQARSLLGGEEAPALERSERFQPFVHRFCRLVVEQPCGMLEQVIDYIWSQQDSAELLRQRAELLDGPHGGFMIELIDQHLTRREFEQSSDAEGGQENGGDRPGEP